MKIGKLTPQDLQAYVLSQLKPPKHAILRPSIGEDCAVLHTKDKVFLSSDPITASNGSQNIGKLAVYVSTNDLAACGATPLGVLITLLVPIDCKGSQILSIMNSAQHACDTLSIDILGGHTEWSDAVNRPIICATAVGEGENVITSSGAKVGDSLIMTKHAGLEGAAVIASEFAKKFALTPQLCEQALGFFDSLSVVNDALVIRHLPISAMHDITEGGVLGAVFEMCESSKVGCNIIAEQIPVHEATQQICDILGLDPYRLLSSGSLLIATSAPQKVQEALKNAGIDSACIGAVTQQGRVLKKGQETLQISYAMDEIARLLEKI